MSAEAKGGLPAQLSGARSSEFIPSQSERIARAILVSPISPSEFRRRLDNGGWNNTISLTNIHLLQKSESSNPSAGLVMAVGGTADPKETRTAAALREVAEETRAVALHERATRDQWDATDPKLINYSIPGYAHPRELSVRVLPVSSFGLNIPRERENGPESEDKIAQVLTFDSSELRMLVTEGSLIRGSEEFHAAGHFTMASVEHDPIEIDVDQRVTQREALTDVLEEVDEFDLSLKRYTKGAINKIRALKGLPQIDDLAEVQEKEELVTGFVAAQMRLALTDERAEESIVGPNKKASLLRVLPYLTSDLPPATLSDLLLYLPTFETVHDTELLAQGFKEGVKVLVTSELIDPPNKDDLLDRLSQEGNIADIDAVAVLGEIWPTFVALRDVDRMPLLREADKATKEGLAEIFVVDQSVVTEAVRAADGFHDFMTQDLRGNGKGTHKYFQDFRPMNDITNATLFTMMAQAVGYHPNRPEIPDTTAIPTIEDRILRFEALRHLALVSVGIEVAEQSQNADISLFEAAIDTFFDKPLKQVMELGEGQLLNVYDRQTRDEVDGRILHIRINEGLKKRVVSAVRKRFQDREVKDMLPISIVVTDENFDPSRDSVEERIKLATSLRDQFIAHARERIGEGDSGWTIEIDDHRTKSIEEILALADKRKRLIADGATPADADEQLKSQDEPGGKRAGSKGNAIIRDKFFMVYNGPGGYNQTIEVNIYPFESTHSPGVEWLSEIGKWGHTEWSLDNAEGNYLANRLTERSATAPMTPTLAEDLYLPLLYMALMEKTGQLVTRKQRLAESS